VTVGGTTNAIYQELLDAAIEVECDVLAGGDDAADATMLKMFGSATVITKELQRLQELNRSPKHYRLGPYHSFLVRELGLPYIQVVNDPDASMGESPLCRVGCAESRPHRHNTPPSTLTLSTRW
jgi:hypothetical protein